MRRWGSVHTRPSLLMSCTHVAEEARATGHDGSCHVRLQESLPSCIKQHRRCGEAAPPAPMCMACVAARETSRALPHTPQGGAAGSWTRTFTLVLPDIHLDRQPTQRRSDTQPPYHECTLPSPAACDVGRLQVQLVLGSEVDPAAVCIFEPVPPGMSRRARGAKAGVVMAMDLSTLAVPPAALMEMSNLSEGTVNAATQLLLQSSFAGCTAVRCGPPLLVPTPAGAVAAACLSATPQPCSYSYLTSGQNRCPPGEAELGHQRA